MAKTPQRQNRKIVMNKICTSLEQSKKLIKLGIDLKTADMYWHKKFDGTLSLRADNLMVKLDTPCWSLAALLNYLREIDFFPDIDADEHSVTMSINYYDEDEGKLLNPVHNIKVKAESFVDACYEMILKLHELKML